MNTTPTPTTDHPNLGIVSLAMAVGGVILPVLVGFVASLLHHDLRTGAYLVFLAFEVAALSIGIVARQQQLGRAGIIVASLFLLLSLPFL